MRNALGLIFVLASTYALTAHNFYQPFKPFDNNVPRGGTPTPTPTPLPVTFDSTANAAGSDTTSISTNITVSASSNRCLIALVFASASLNSVSNPNIQNVATSFGDMTQVGTFSFNGGASIINIYTKVAPTSGATAVTLNTSGDVANLLLGVADIHNVNQTTPLGTLFTGTATSTTATVSVTGTGTQSLVLNIAGYDTLGTPSATLTAGGGQTQMFNPGAVGDSPGERGAGGRQTAGGTISPSWTISSSNIWGMVGFEVKP